MGRSPVAPLVTGDELTPADELTPSEVLEELDDIERAILIGYELELDGLPATMHRALDRALGEARDR